MKLKKVIIEEKAITREQESVNDSALTEDQVRHKIFGGCIGKGIPLREHPKVAFHALSV